MSNPTMCFVLEASNNIQILFVIHRGLYMHIIESAIEVQFDWSLPMNLGAV